ncbi:MAG: HAMP domain-containing sensor histidine kinase [Chloroflexota bacterium]
MSGDVNRQQREILSRVESRLNALMELINDLLALAASKTVELQEPARPIALQPILQHEVEALAQEARDKQVRLELRAPSEDLIVRATPDGLTQIFRNLIGNAIKYTPSGGRAEVRVAAHPGRAEILVRDTGIGIPAEEMTHLWEEFFRASNARRSGIVGTGLGLSIVKRLVEIFDGLISVHSVEGKGTTFTVILPLVSPDEAR